MSQTDIRTPVYGMETAGRLAAGLFRPIDVASLVFFRVAFGGVMLWEVWRYFHYGWVERYYVEPGFHFTYFGFAFVRPWPAAGMYAHFVCLAVLAAGIVFGLFYRLCAALFFVGFSYVFLLEQARYLNHFYLVCLLSLILIFVPAHRAFSLDALRKPDLRSQTIPAWPLWLLRAQIGIVYFYGGLAKLNGDWLRGEPMRMWLADRADFSIFGPWFQQESAVYFFSYGGLLFDLAVVPLLLWRRTRAFALALAVLFHLMNFYLFHIGIFPWLMIAATLLFLPPGWPRRLMGQSSATTAVLDRPAGQPPTSQQRRTRWLLGCYLAVQLLFPLRHFLYPGNVSWTEEGHRFAWHMKLRSKWADARFFCRVARPEGRRAFSAVPRVPHALRRSRGGPTSGRCPPRTGPARPGSIGAAALPLKSGPDKAPTEPATREMWEFDASRYLTFWQYDEMSTRPDMILQFAHFLADQYRRENGTSIEVRAVVLASLNGRRPQLLIDPEADLAGIRRSLLPAWWILPLSSE